MRRLAPVRASCQQLGVVGSLLVQARRDLSRVGGFSRDILHASKLKVGVAAILEDSSDENIGDRIGEIGVGHARSVGAVRGVHAHALYEIPPNVVLRHA